MATEPIEINLPVEENKANGNRPHIRSIEELEHQLIKDFSLLMKISIPVTEPKTLVDEWVEVVSSLIDAPELSIRAAGYFIFSSLATSKVRITNLRGKKRPPNLYIVILGKAGSTRKTTLRDDYVGDTLEKVMGEDAFLIRKVDRSSPEGLADAAVDVQNLVERGEDKWGRVVFIMPDEFSDFMEDVTRKDYEKGTLSLHKILKDGSGVNTRLSKRNKNYWKREIRRGTYATLLGIGQPVKKTCIFNIRHIAKGYMRRLVIIRLKKQDKNKDYPPVVPTTMESVYNKERLEHLQDRIKSFAVLLRKFDIVEARLHWGTSPNNPLAEYRKYSDVPINYIYGYFKDLKELDPPEEYLDEEYHNLIDLSVIEALTDPASITELQKQAELWEKGDLTEIEKYLVEYGLNRLEIEKILKRAKKGEKIGIVKVKPVHIAKALPFFLRMLRDKKEIISEILGAPKDLDLPSYEKYKIRLMSTFNKHAEDYKDENDKVLGRKVQLSWMLSRAGLDPDDRNTIAAIRQLLADGRIFIVKAPGRGRGGNTQTVFNTKNAAVHFYKKKIKEMVRELRKKNPGATNEYIKSNIEILTKTGVIALYDRENAFDYEYKSKKF